jgi:hypothetical protein
VFDTEDVEGLTVALGAPPAVDAFTKALIVDGVAEFSEE